MIAGSKSTRNSWRKIFVSLENVAERPVLVAVKGNAYGHAYEIAAKAFVKGRRPLSRRCQLCWKDCFSKKAWHHRYLLLILGGILPDEMALAAAAAGSSFLFFDLIILKARTSDAKNVFPYSWCTSKLDATGMGRLGHVFRKLVAALSALQLKKIPGMYVIAGLATHFAKAGPPGSEFTGGQIDKFLNCRLAALAAIGIRPEIIHASKSGTVDHPRPRYDMVRLGIIAYGVAPAVEGFVLPDGVRTAFTWHARITSTKILPKAAGVSYSANYVMPKEARIGILPVGYADGYRRLLNVNSVLIDGQEREDHWQRQYGSMYCGSGWIPRHNRQAG